MAAQPVRPTLRRGQRSIRNRRHGQRRRPTATRRRQPASAALEATETRYRELLDSLPVAVFEIDLEGHVIFANRTGSTLFGYDQADLARGLSVWDMLAPADRERVTVNIQRRLCGQLPNSPSEYLGLRKQGNTFPISIHSVPIVKHGKPAGLRGVIVDLSERQQARQALEESEARYRAVVEAYTDMIVRYRTDGIITYVNDAFCRYFGKERDELLGRQYAPEVPPEDFKQAFPDYSIFTPDRPVRVSEHRVILPGGRIRWLQWTDHALFDGAGRLLEFQSLVRDVSERKQAELVSQALQRLSTSLQRTHDLGEAMNLSLEAAMEAAGLDCGAVYLLNDREDLSLCCQIGLPPAALPLFALIPAQDQLARRILAGEPRFSSVPYTASDPRAQAAGVNCAAILPLLHEGDVIGCLAIGARQQVEFDQATRAGLLGVAAQAGSAIARLRAEATLRERERFLSTLMANLPGMAYRCLNDQFWTMEFVSDGALALTGYRPDEIVQNRIISYEDVILPEDRELVRRQVAPALEAGTPFELEYRIRSKDGQLKWAWERGRGVKNGDGPVQHIEGFILDVTGRKQLEQQFLQVQKMETVGRLAGGIAHDFNNLLTAISGNLAFAMQELGQPDVLREDLQQAIDAAGRAANLTRQLLAFSRKQIIQPRLLDLNELVLEMDRMLRRLIGENIELVVIPADNLPQVRADPAQIEQVLINLAVNSRDAMPSGGRLTIETGRARLEGEAAAELGVSPGEYVSLSVCDNGVGMSEEVKHHIFEPFFTTKGVGQGSGMGLATVYGIVKQHSGGISFRSELNAGTCFSVFLPAWQVAQPETATPRQSESLPGGSESVLLVEDEPLVRALAARILRGVGYQVHEAANAVEALRLASSLERPVDLLLTDIVMPKVGGRELAAILRAKQPELKVLYVSGYSEIAPDVSVSGRSAFLGKPFTKAALARKVRELLDQK